MIGQFACVVGIVVAGASLVSADEGARSEADKLIRHGIELRRNRDDQAAAREFEKAYKLARSPRAAGQLGLAEQALGRWQDAERHIGEAVSAAQDPWVLKNRAALDAALATIQQHIGRIEVLGDPEGAEVSVNGRRVGKLPLPEAVRISAGQVDVDVQAPGYAPAPRVSASRTPSAAAGYV